MKIFSKEQIYKGDAVTVERQNITSTDLMERAGTQIFNWIDLHMQGAQVPIHVFCGIGNNGGDGLVLARLLITHGYHVFTYIVNYSDKRSNDFLINYDRIKDVTKSWPILLNSEVGFPEIGQDDVIVDAVFGIGINRPITSWVKHLFIHFKTSNAFTLSIDIPSGLYVNKAITDHDAVVYATCTLSFVCPKLVFFLPETATFTKQWVVLDIGFDAEFLNTSQTDVSLIGKHEVLPNYIPRDQFSHKGLFGHALIIGGSYGKIGAVTLASRGALSAGAGLVSAYVPKCGYTILQTAFPEAMVITDTHEKVISSIEYDIEPTVIAFGVGLGTNTKTIQAFESFLKTNKSPLVIDADGINILTKKKALLKFLPSQTILTPHPKELERLIGSWKNDFDKLEKAKAFSKKHDLILVLKGAHTITIYHSKMYINSTGNPGLSTAGSGDVLTGIITGLISQGYNYLAATIFGVYLHGKSADIATADFGYESLIASHIIAYIGKAYLDLFKQPESSSDNQEKTDKKE